MVEVRSESLECKVSAKRMWEGLITDAHNCLPRALPHKVLGIEYPLGQHGFTAPGAVRIIKYYKVIEDDLHKAEAATKKFLHEQATHAKAELEKVAHIKEAADLVKEKMRKMEEGLVKETHFVEEEIGGGGATHKAIEAAEKVVHKEGKLEEGGATHKVGELVELEVMEVKEKIEEIDHEACKITVSVIGGGLLGVLFLHYKHSFHLEDTKEGGSKFHWASEFEALSKSVLSFEDHKKHVLDTFHFVEAYLLKHDNLYIPHL